MANHDCIGSIEKHIRIFHPLKIMEKKHSTVQTLGKARTQNTKVTKHTEKGNAQRKRSRIKAAIKKILKMQLENFKDFKIIIKKN